MNKYPKLLTGKLLRIFKTKVRTARMMIGVEQPHLKRTVKGPLNHIRQRQQRGESVTDCMEPV